MEGGSLRVPAELARRITLSAVLLTFGTGGVDVLSITRLGGVFTSVITGNLVLLGLAAARASAGLAGRTALSVASYAAGVAAGARVIAAAPRRPRPQAAGWPPMVTAALAVELALLALLAAGWELASPRPAGAGQYLLQVTAAVAMGMQSAAVRGLGRGEYATTYLTGTLTAMVAGLATPGKRRWPGWQQPGALLALAAGALVNGSLIAYAPAAVPAVTLAPLCAVLILHAAARRGSPGRSRGELTPTP